MKVVLQRVTSASVNVDKNVISKIDHGLLLLWGIEKGDTFEDIETLTKKILKLRIFADEDGKMNKSIIDVSGEILLVSQFTLNGDISKGNRPSFVNSEDPEIAEQMIEDVKTEFSNYLNVKEGSFGELMEVSLVNDGPLTMYIQSKNGNMIT
ncbi:D-aminoacyl-tRNA deacylase [Acidimicrobiaceae bacterium]|nr:D-aminoacyl-tRNA deacylase [Acidimicrobiaceae bacterium]|tara:strand:- start:3 stop:458 length:456 start_codon:yes stop_codon:yes gene_type:complete